MGVANDREVGGAGKARSRRRLLAGGTGALAAVLTAEALARPAPAAAANGGNVILGQGNTETSGTTISNSSGGDFGLEVDGTGSSTGLIGHSDSGIGVDGESSSGTGVRGFSGSGEGVYGQNGHPVSGFSGVTNGVHGITDTASGVGVIGENTGGGTAVGGISSTGDGVGGTSSSGNGVHGVSSSGGTGVLAENFGGGNALRVAGSAVFSRSGVLTVAAGSSKGTVTGVALTAASLVLATLQQNLSGVYVRSAVPNVAGSSFTINLSKAPSASAKVAWFVVN